MSKCKHSRITDVSEVCLAVCDECGENEYDIVKRKVQALQSQVRKLKAERDALSEAVQFAHDTSDVRLSIKWATYMELLRKKNERR